MSAQRVFDFIESFLEENGYGPTWREIERATRLTAPSVQVRLNYLRQKGRIDWVDGQPRTIRIIRPNARPVMVPVELVPQVEALIASHGGVN